MFPDNTYQLELERGTHKSIPLYEKVYGARKEPEWKATLPLQYNL